MGNLEPRGVPHGHGWGVFGWHVGSTVTSAEEGLQKHKSTILQEVISEVQVEEERHGACWMQKIKLPEASRWGHLAPSPAGSRPLPLPSLPSPGSRPVSSTVRAKFHAEGIAELAADPSMAFSKGQGARRRGSRQGPLGKRSPILVP